MILRGIINNACNNFLYNQTPLVTLVIKNYSDQEILKRSLKLV